MRKKIELEYLFASSINVLFSRLSTATGLAEWFADDVRQKGDSFVFVWEGTEEKAEMTDLKKNDSVSFQWEDADDHERLTFSLRVDPLTEDVALIVSDYVDDDDEEDSIELWNKQIETLQRILGA